MPTYAILGSTGNTGTALITNLLREPSNRINAFCRNATKLHRILPETLNNPQIQTFEGQTSDRSLVGECVRDCRAVFLCITTNDNIPYCSLAQDTAKHVVDALNQYKSSNPSARMPKVVLLSSVSNDEHMARVIPWVAHFILSRGISWVYADLRVAEAFLRQQEDWLTSIFVMPGGLSPDIQRGHSLTFDGGLGPTSYLDLAAAMIETADDGEGRYDMRRVGVGNPNGDARFAAVNAGAILLGLVRHYFPWLHGYLPLVSGL